MGRALLQCTLARAAVDKGSAIDKSRYQIIRAISEDKTDITEISLIYANRSEEDILMRSQLDRFSAQSNGQLKVYYMVGHTTPSWTEGVGFVYKQIIEERLPVPSEGEMQSP